MENQTAAAETDRQLEEIRSGARILFNPKQLVEVRAMGANGYWRGLYFDDHERMARVVQQLDRDERIQSIYYVFNEINQKLVENRQKCECDKCVRGGLIVRNPTPEQVEKIIMGPSQHLTTNEDVKTIRWLFIDVDTIRAAGHEHDPSTKAEKAACKEVANQVLLHLGERGWSNVLLGDSGNGFHILPRIEQPNTPATIMYIEDCLKALSKKFTCAAAEIDSGVFNPARLTRAYGTTTRKGTATEERPHRLNRLKKPEEVLRLITFDQITALADEAPKTGKTIRGDMPLLHENFDPDDFFQWFEDQGAFEVTGVSNWQGHEVKIIDHCIISGTKHTGSKLTGFIIGDSFGYHCWSPECEDPQIGDVLHKLHELGFKRYPKKIWVEEPPLLNFDADILGFETTTLQESSEPYELPMKKETSTIEKPESETKAPVQEAPVEEKSTLVALEQEIAQEEKKAPPAPSKEPPHQLEGMKPNQYAEWLIGIILRDPETAHFSYTMYRRRLKHAARHLTDIVRETFGALMLFEQTKRHLPTKAELLDFVAHDPACMEDEFQGEMVAFLKIIKDDGTHFFDTTAERLIWEVDWELEVYHVKEAYTKILKEKRNEIDCIQSFRTALRKHWAATMGLDSDFRPGSIQENTEAISEAFRRDVAGEVDDRKFKFGFDSIDNSGMNIGLDGMRAIVLYGPKANRKTTTVLTLALNFAMQGKHVLFLCGEHGRMKIQKSMAITFSHFLRKTEDNPEGIDIIPGLNKWEGVNKSVTWDDFENVNKVLQELKTKRLIPGHLEVQNIQALARGEEDALSAIMSYVDATNRKCEWDAIIIDPLDSILPNEGGGKDKNHYQACCSVVDRLFDYSRNFSGDRGLMVIVTAQFKSDAIRGIEKAQAKNGGADSFDDEIEAFLHQDSLIQYVGSKLGQRFDLAFGVACRVKNGSEGMIVQGRCREAGNFDVLHFKVDPESNLIFEDSGVLVHRIHGETQPAAAESVMEPYDIL